jgi:hypothetical protein
MEPFVTQRISNRWAVLLKNFVQLVWHYGGYCSNSALSEVSNISDFSIEHTVLYMNPEV